MDDGDGLEIGEGVTMNAEQLEALSSDGKVVSQAGDPIGDVDNLYLDDSTGEPTWVTVNTGLVSETEAFIPLQGAEVRGHEIVVDYDEQTVRDAPRVDGDGAIDPEEETSLLSYYGAKEAQPGGSAYNSATPAGAALANLAGGAPDDEPTSSQAQVADVSQAPTQTLVDAAKSGQSVSEVQHEVVLHEDVPTVDKELVSAEEFMLGSSSEAEHTVTGDEKTANDT